MSIVAVRTDRGRLHVARLEGRTYVGACHRTVTVARAVVYEGRDRDRAWRHELRCVDCDNLTRRGILGLIKVAGW